jgi:O-antigen ligase
MAMSQRVAQARTSSSVAFVAVALLVAGGIGVLAAQGPTLAIAFFVAVIAVPTAVFRPKVMAHVLVVLIFAQYVTVHGITVQRLAAPLALIAVASRAINDPMRLPGAARRLAWVGAYSAWALLSVTWTVSSSGTDQALASLGIAITFLLAFAVLVRTKEELTDMLWTVTACTAVLAVWWIVSYLAGVDRAHNKAGDPNFNAMLLTMAIPLILVLTRRAVSPLRRAGLYAVIALAGGGVVATLSRGGLLALAAVAVVIVALPARTFFHSRSQKGAFLAAGLIGLVILLALTWGALVSRFQENSNQLDRGSGRGDLWAAALHGYHEHPFTGIGYGAFLASSQELLASTPGVNLKHFLNFNRLGGQEVHSAYLGSLTELGPVGLALFVAILLGTMRSLMRTGARARSEGDEEAGVMASALAVSLLAFIVASAFLSSETSGRGLWMIIGLALVLPSAIVPAPPADETETA